MRTASFPRGGFTLAEMMVTVCLVCIMFTGAFMLVSLTSDILGQVGSLVQFKDDAYRAREHISREVRESTLVRIDGDLGQDVRVNHVGGRVARFFFSPGGDNSYALLVAMVLILLGALVMTGISSFSNHSVHMTVKRGEALKAFHVAEAVLQKIHGDLNMLYLTQGGATEEDLASFLSATDTPDLEQPFSGYITRREDGMPGLTVTRTSSAFYGPLAGGSYRGLMAQQQDYLLDVSVIHALNGFTSHMTRERRYAAAGIQETLRAEAIPLAQFFAFYDNDLEIQPGPTMYMEGRVHTNGDLWIGAGASLTIDAGMTAVGRLIHQRKDSQSVASGSIMIKNGEGNYVSMNQDGTWIDSDHPDWAEQSVELFDSLVQNQDHGVPRLRLPINLTESPHDVLERTDAGDSPELARAKFHNKAGLSILDGLGLDANGASVPLTYPDPAKPWITKSVISYKSWYDYREGRTAMAVEINVGNLIESGRAPANGVLYISKQGDTNSSRFDAVRLVNGQKLPGSGLTVATDVPLYIKGDYNTVDKTSALVAADAVNILSNNWSDSNTTYSSRVATNTTIQAVVMMGNTETVLDGAYNGGLENSLRFSEKWSGKTLSFRGSLINLWNSETATGAWHYGSPVYEAPNRDWRFDPFYLDPLNSPPGIPTVYAFETVAFLHSY